jgi:signal transduction histidine kinase
MCGQVIDRPAVRDAGLAAGLLGVAVVLGPPYRPISPFWWVTTGAVVIAVGLRSRWPVVTLAVGVAGTALHIALGALIGVTDTAVLIFVYTVAARRSRRVSLAVLTAVLLIMLGWSGWYTLRGRLVPGMPVIAFQVKHATAGAPPTNDRTVLIAGDRASGAARWSGPVVLGSALFAAWAVGYGTRSRQAYLDQATARAEDLEREQGQRAALAVAAERGRISRELHDVVAHGLSLIVIQAQGGAAALDVHPAATRAALDAIVRTGRGSLTDMRRVLDAMGEVDDTWHPQPGLAQLPTLIDHVRQAGTAVRLRVDGTAVPLPVPVDLSAYRIVQEALTNVMKHAGVGARADVVIAYRETALHLRITDNGAAVKTTTGNGISGMRERVRLLGGAFTAGPGAAEGFEVTAVLPIRDEHT